MSGNLVDAMVNMKEKEALAIAKELVESGEDPLKVLGLCKEALEMVGKRFEEGTYFLPELVLAGEMMRQISDMVNPKLRTATQSEPLGKVVMGTVKGDIHDLGKDIVTFMLDVSGFHVLDLGIDVPPEKFVEAIKEFQPQVVGLSGFLTLAFESMKTTVGAIDDAGLRNNVKIMIGGGQIDDEVRKHTGADAFGLDAMDAVKLSKKWVGGI
ncbi:MAG: cobalamin-dependent protein [Desulfatiglandales bacterium]